MSAAGEERTGRGALHVGAGILGSRIVGLVRQRALAHYLGLSFAADAFNAAFRIPNFLQNLFGEGVLSASFIPVYARLLAEGKEEEAGRTAGAVLTLLALATAVLVLLGMLATPLLIGLIAPGFQGDKRTLTIYLVRLLFPGAGLLVMSAWCLGVLNSHRRFLLSYSAPIAWNVSIIVALVLTGDRAEPSTLAVAAAAGSVVGSALQLLVQLPTVWRLVPTLTLSLGHGSQHVRTVIANFVPVFIGRGVVQISAYVDTVIASFLPGGAVAALASAQVLYTLPVSLFGMSVSAAELPAMSSATGSAEDVAAVLRARLALGLRRIAYLVVPSAVAFAALGDVVAAALFQTGRFSHDDALYVWGILAGSAVGLLASTLGRLYSSAFYALRDTRTPLRYAILRVALTTALGLAFALPLPKLLGVAPRWGAAGLTASAGIAGWVEFWLLRRGLGERVGPVTVGASFLARLWTGAALAAAAGYALKTAMAGMHPLEIAFFVLGAYGVLYFALTAAMGVAESRAAIARAFRR
ncbi:MAG TPA: murein biosynthesis integral membrane protein MurJ [Gemmatimonadaceae bacterium]|nr:murein biosynthesis integral membrane protein MurJ [Gemmatimonadaceae bacterium]